MGVREGAGGGGFGGGRVNMPGTGEPWEGVPYEPMSVWSVKA